MSSPGGASQPSRSPRTWIRCRRSSLRAKTTNSSGAAAPAIPRASSRPCCTPCVGCSKQAHEISGCCSWWAKSATAPARYAAAKDPRGSKFIINGEPTENKLALGSKGALRLELVASGRMAHSAYPELGESAIEKLLDALQAIRRVQLPVDKILGASTLNIGTIAGGRAPNVIPDRRARGNFHSPGGRWRFHARCHPASRRRQSRSP